MSNDPTPSLRRALMRASGLAIRQTRASRWQVSTVWHWTGVLLTDRAPAGGSGELIADGMSCPLVVWREHWFIRSLMVLPLAVQGDRRRGGQAGCCSWGMTGPRRTMMWS